MIYTNISLILLAWELDLLYHLSIVKYVISPLSLTLNEEDQDSAVYRCFARGSHIEALKSDEMNSICLS